MKMLNYGVKIYSSKNCNEIRKNCKNALSFRTDYDIQCLIDECWCEKCIPIVSEYGELFKLARYKNIKRNNILVDDDNVHYLAI